VEAYSAAVAALADKAVPASASMFSATGMPRIYEEMDNNLISSQLQSLLIALLLTFILLTIQFRSLGAGAIAVVPIVFTVAGEFGLMAFAGVALDTATVLIASLAVGIGIDYTIHYMSRLKIEAERNPGTLEAISATSRTTGVAIAINAASVAAGFFILVFANLVPLQNFGWMTATTMLISAFAALTLLPMLLSFGKGAARLVGRRNHGSK
jgi:predicted RND superfamily exporter protein